MYTVKEAIIVEGVYDKIKLSRFIDAVIIVINGFCIYKNTGTLEFIKKMAKETGIVIFTDSDAAGFRIRNYIKQSVKEGTVFHAYIPDVAGKEKRKTAPGKAGLLGVEGISDDIILDALKRSGCTVNGFLSQRVHDSGLGNITKADFMKYGLSGGRGSSEKRKALCRQMRLPEKISANMLLDVLNRLVSHEEFCEIAQTLNVQ